MKEPYKRNWEETHLDFEQTQRKLMLESILSLQQTQDEIVGESIGADFGSLPRNMRYASQKNLEIEKNESQKVLSSQNKIGGTKSLL